MEKPKRKNLLGAQEASSFRLPLDTKAIFYKDKDFGHNFKN